MRISVCIWILPLSGKCLCNLYLGLNGFIFSGLPAVAVFPCLFLIHGQSGIYAHRIYFFIEKIFPFLGVRFIAVTDNFDSMNVSGQDGTLGVNLKNLVNEMYARDIAVLWYCEGLSIRSS